MLLNQIITAANGFLIAVLWFDLMFDAQVIRHGHAPQVPDAVLDSIATYYRRVTTTSSPMSRLVVVTMLLLSGGLVAQLLRTDTPVWVSAPSLLLALLGIGLAGARVVPAAKHLGTQTDTRDVQSRVARAIFRDHMICLAAMVSVLAVQLVGA